jgi:chromosome segregation ATPase
MNDFKERENNLNALNADLNLKLKESTALTNKVNSLDKDLDKAKHQIELKDLELKAEKKSFNDLNALYNKADKENSKLKTEIDTLKDTISSLKAEVAEMNVIKSQLEDEKKRSDELQKALLASVEKNYKTKLSES